MRLQYRKIWPVLLGCRTAILPWAESWFTLYANKTNLILVDIQKFSLHLFLEALILAVKEATTEHLPTSPVPGILNFGKFH